MTPAQARLAISHLAEEGLFISKMIARTKIPDTITENFHDRVFKILREIERLESIAEGK